MSTSTNNNNNLIQSKNPEPTIRDVIALLQNSVPSKIDMETMKQEILAAQDENKKKIEIVEQQVDVLTNQSSSNAGKITQLEETIQILQQDKLKNNISISGVPLNNDINATDALLKIASALQIDIVNNDFSAYATSNKKFIVVMFNNYMLKQSFINKMRIKKSLFVEEVFSEIKSNSQIYINEHLTKYFNDLFLNARSAKKEGKLTSVTSSGGKIRVRKNPTDPAKIVTNADQLKTIIEMNAKANQQISDGSQTANKNKRGRKSSPSQKTRQQRSSSTTKPSKKPKKN